MRPLIVIATMLVWPYLANAFEPSTAFDDAFSVPTTFSAEESVLHYPGMESYTAVKYLAGAWSVPFGVDELTVTSGLAGFHNGVFGGSASFSSTGFDLYGEEFVKLGVSYRPADMISAGLRLTRCSMRIKGYGRASALSGDAGIVIRPSQNLFLAASVEDIAGAEMGDSKDALDGHSRLAVSWRMPVGVALFASASHAKRYGTSVSAGFMAEVSRTLILGLAGGSEPDRIEFISGVRIKRTRFSYRGNYHRYLGMTHGFSMIWRNDG